MEKFSLIDLEAQQWATGRKQAQAVQRERLSEKTSFAGRCDSLNSDITKKVAEFGSKNLNRQKWSVSQKLKVTDCNNDSIPTRLDVLYGWANLYPELACRVAA
jgi:hypothetical protein